MTNLEYIVDAICKERAQGRLECANRYLAQITDAMWEASNGLSMGWMAANVKEDEARSAMQAPITAGQDAILTLLRDIPQTR